MTTAKYHGNGGMYGEKATADKVFTAGTEYEVISGEVSSFYSWIELSGVKGQWNSRLFDVDLTEAPVKVIIRNINKAKG